MNGGNRVRCSPVRASAFARMPEISVACANTRELAGAGTAVAPTCATFVEVGLEPELGIGMRAACARLDSPSLGKRNPSLLGGTSVVFNGVFWRPDRARTARSRGAYFERAKPS